MRNLLSSFLFAIAFASQCPPPSEDAPMICTYYEPVFAEFKEFADDYSGLLRIWEESWAMQGWRPVILRERDAQKHPLYAENIQNLKKMPTMNKMQYELACYLRWFAAVQVGCGTLF